MIVFTAFTILGEKQKAKFIYGGIRNLLISVNSEVQTQGENEQNTVQTANGKCSSQDDNCQDSRKTDLPYDIIGSAVPLMSEYNIQDFAYGKVNASGIYVPDK